MQGFDDRKKFVVLSAEIDDLALEDNQSWIFFGNSYVKQAAWFLS